MRLSRVSFKRIYKSTLTTSIVFGTLFTPTLLLNRVFAGPGMFEVQWDAPQNFKRLKSLQTSDERFDRSTYYLFLRGSERKAAILKLNIKFFLLKVYI